MTIKKEDFKPLFKYLKPYKKAIWITAIFVIVENVIVLLSPIFIGRAIDIALQKYSFTREVLIFLVLWSVINVIGALFTRIRMKRSAKISYRASQDLIVSSIEHLMKLPLSYHKNKRIGEVIQKFTRADSYLYGFIDNGLFQLAPNLISAFLAFIIISWINWRLSVVYVLFIVFYVVVIIIKTDPIVAYQKKLNRLFEKVYGDIFDRTPNIINIKSNTSENEENARNLENFGKGYDLNNNQMNLWTNLIFWENSIFSGGFLILYGLGIYLISVRLITIGEFVILRSYVSMLSAYINNLADNYKRLQEGIVTVNRSEKIFEEIPENYDDPVAIEMENIRGEVEFKNISFSYDNDKERVLENISFKAEAGKIVAIVGKSGEGKSTLVDLISRYNIPQKGKIILDGVDIQSIKLKSLRDQIAIVPQEVDLFNDTIRNNISYSKFGASEEEIIRAAKLAHCHDFIENFPKKYDQVVGEKGVKLSTGQKQRVAIARAILRNPKILILDEATSALDSESEKYVQEALKEVMKNRTTFVIAHRLSTIRNADLILVLEEGKIVESGDHQELLAHGGVYRKLSELQQVNF